MEYEEVTHILETPRKQVLTEADLIERLHPHDFKSDDSYWEDEYQRIRSFGVSSSGVFADLSFEQKSVFILTVVERVEKFLDGLGDDYAQGKRLYDMTINEFYRCVSIPIDALPDAGDVHKDVEEGVERLLNGADMPRSSRWMAGKFALNVAKSALAWLALTERSLGVFHNFKIGCHAYAMQNMSSNEVDRADLPEMLAVIERTKCRLAFTNKDGFTIHNPYDA